MNCRVCGSPLSEGTLFCGVCGSAVSATPARRATVEDSRPSDTTIIAPFPAEGIARPAVAGPPSPVRSVPIPDVPLPEAVAPVVAEEAEDDEVEPLRVEISQPSSGITFAFTFSTGETVTVAGNGLVGRRPLAQDGEDFDQLISIADTERTVSKTHLEFGVEGHQLWVCDRFSANGSAIRRLDGKLRACEPGRRYLVERGARVEVGDQYFDVG